MIPEWAKNGQGLPRGKLSAHLKQKLIYLDLLRRGLKRAVVLDASHSQQSRRLG